MTLFQPQVSQVLGWPSASMAGVEMKVEQFFSVINFCEQMTLKKICYASKIILYK